MTESRTKTHVGFNKIARLLQTERENENQYSHSISAFENSAITPLSINTHQQLKAAGLSFQKSVIIYHRMAHSTCKCRMQNVECRMCTMQNVKCVKFRRIKAISTTFYGFYVFYIKLLILHDVFYMVILPQNVECILHCHLCCGVVRLCTCVIIIYILRHSHPHCEIHDFFFINQVGLNYVIIILFLCLKY